MSMCKGEREFCKRRYYYFQAEQPFVYARFQVENLRLNFKLW